MKKTITLLKDNKKNRGLVEKTKNSNCKTRYIILSFIPQAIHTITAVLDVPNGILEKGAKALEVITACTDNVRVPIDETVIELDLENLKAYDTATTPAQHDSTWKVVHKDLKWLMRQVQDAADADPAEAVNIIESCKLRVKKVAIKQAQVFGATNGVDSGVVDLVGPTARGQHCHDWWVSLDGTTFVRMRPTLESTTQMKGLKPLTYAWFMHELIVTKNGKGLSAPIRIQVK